MYDAIQQQLGEVGIKIEYEMTDGATWVRKWYYREPDSDAEAILLGRNTMTDPDQWLSSTMLSTGIAANATGYANAELDELIIAGRAGLSNAERAPIYQEIATMIRRDLPYATLWCCAPSEFIWNTRFVHPYWKDFPQATSLGDIGVGSQLSNSQEWLKWHIEDWDIVAQP